MSALYNFLFIAMPYIALATFLIGSIQRYRSNAFKYSSLSSQFLEGSRLYFGAVAFHWAIVAVFLGHLAVFIFPGLILAWNSSPVRLIAHEVVAFTFGLSALVGLVALLVRRLSDVRVRTVTSPMDFVIEFLILGQIVLGCWIALGYRWGSSWFAADLSPYLWSIVKLNPQTEAVSAMPWVIQSHIVGAFLIVALIPFTRLLHFLVAPFHYIWRPYQKVVWYWDRKRVRNPNTAWTTHQPKNN